jgi:hypothetical protein
MDTGKVDSACSDTTGSAPRFVTSAEYGAICDVVERAWLHESADSYKSDPFSHTSDYARAAAVGCSTSLRLLPGDDAHDDRTQRAEH